MRETTISIPGVKKEQFEVTIVGDTPLLTHRFAPETQKEIEDGQEGKPKGARSPRKPQEEFQRSKYTTADGEPGFPAGALKEACVAACRVLATKMTEARAAFYVIGDALNMLPVRSDPPVMHSAMSGHVKARRPMMAYRAMYANWRISLIVRHNPDVMTKESIANMLEYAGFHIGIGAWRPEKGGTYGMFHVQREAP